MIQVLQTFSGLKGCKMSANMADSALPYICKTCKKRFRRINHLQEHVIVHSGVKPFICPVCHRPFPRRSQLRLHHSLHHASILYKCRQCHASFLQKAHLCSHLLLEHHISQHQHTPVRLPVNQNEELKRTFRLNGGYHAKCVTNGIIRKSHHRGKRKTSAASDSGENPLNMPLQSMTVMDWSDLCNSHTDANDNVMLDADNQTSKEHDVLSSGLPTCGLKLTNKYTMLLENGGCDSMDGLGESAEDLDINFPTAALSPTKSPPRSDSEDAVGRNVTAMLSCPSPHARSSQVTSAAGMDQLCMDAYNETSEVDIEKYDDEMRMDISVSETCSPSKLGPSDDPHWVASSPLRGDGLLSSSHDPSMDVGLKLPRRGSSESLLTLISSTQSEEMPDDLSRHGDPPVDPPDDLSRHGDEEHHLILELDASSEEQSDDEGPPALELMSGDDDPGSPPTLTKMCDSSVHRLHKLTGAVDCPETQAAGISPQYLTSREEAASIGHGSPPSDVDSKTSQIGPQSGTQYTSFFNEFAKFVNQLEASKKEEDKQVKEEKADQSQGSEKLPTLRVVLKPVKTTQKEKRKTSRKEKSNRNVFSIFDTDADDVDFLPGGDDKKHSSKPRRARRVSKHYVSDAFDEDDDCDVYSGSEENKRVHSSRPRRARRVPKHYTCDILEVDDDEDYHVHLGSDDSKHTHSSRPQRTRRLPKHYMCECCIHSEHDSVRKHRINAKRLHTQMQAVERLRHRLCVLFNILFTQLPYPPRFSHNTHAVESLLNQIIIAATDQDNGLGYPSNDISSAVSVIVCKSPRQCLQQLRRKTVQLIKTLLPSLDLDPEFDTCSEDVDHLLEEVILSNSGFASNTAGSRNSKHI